MCFSSSKSNASSEDVKTTAGDNSTAIGAKVLSGAGASNTETYGLQGGDLDRLFDYLENFGQGAKELFERSAETTTTALQEVRTAQLQQTQGNATALTDFFNKNKLAIVAVAGITAAAVILKKR